MQRKSKNRRSAFTLVELAMVAVVVAILSITAWPNREADDQAKLDAAMTRLESDVEYARNIALTTPTDPSVIKMDMAQDSYWIARSSAPDTPVTNPSTRKPYVVQLGSSGDASVRDVKIVAENFGTNHMLVFDGRGSVNASGNLGVQFRSGTRTGSLKITAGSGATRQLGVDLGALGLTNVVADTLDDVGGLVGGLTGGGV